MKEVVPPLCPKCMQPYRWIERHKVRGRVYLYAVHGERREGGKRKVERCYLGPVDRYRYVSELQSVGGLKLIELKGMSDPRRFYEYLEGALEALLYIINQPTQLLSVEEKRRLAEDTVRLLEEYLPKFRSASARLAEEASQKQF